MDLRNVLELQDDISQKLNWFLRKICREMLENPSWQNLVQEEMEVFIDGLYGTRFIYNAHVELCGIELETQLIEIEHADIDFKLRPTTKSDFSVDTPAEQIRNEPRRTFLDEANIIMNIGLYEPGPNTIENVTEKVVSVLRLFKVGSIHSIKIKRFTRAYDLFGTGTSANQRNHFPNIKYQIRNEEVDQLKTFWHSIYSLLPENFLDYPNAVDSLAIAYFRYSDSLLVRVNVENRIALAVMGLESLWSENKPEIAYRLRKRTAKILGFIGFNTLKVDSFIKQGYVIRSNYVHGNIAKARDTEKMLEKLEIASLETLWKEILDYLRVSIIIMIVAQKSKDEIITLTDKALIDAQSHTLLTELLEPIKTLLAP